MTDHTTSAPVLVCFAVREEAAFFRGPASAHPALRVQVTGMGAANARKRLAQAMSSLSQLPRAVITSGFAGGLSTAAQPNEVLVETNSVMLRDSFVAAGARCGRFHCATRVACTVTEKRRLAEQTGADAVEMESGTIQEACRQAGLPCATVRVILDPAGQDLPLDFNLLLNERFQLSPVKLACAVLKRPAVIPHLLRFQRQTRAASQALARVLLEGIRKAS